MTLNFFVYLCHMKETKKQILNSAISIWGDDLNGTLDDIAGHTGISRRTLHRHYTGREDLMNSVFNHIIDEYLIHLRGIINTTSNEKDKLKDFLFYDIESGSRYLIFCQLRKAKYTEIETENANLKELYSIYISLFEGLKENQQIRKELSLNWLETLYMLIVETAVRSIDNGIDKKEVLEMAWSTFWNGIKGDSR